ncbi:MAG: stage II sporulation protein R [Clostridia bacterium]|nr:stage II sporulation protein R [Clostridia bacterium]
MKVLTTLCASFLIAYVILSVFPSNGEETIYSDMIRLHVIADSDEEKEQELKLKVRDVVLEKVTELTKGITDTEEALSVVEENLWEISNIGQEEVRKNGYNHNVIAEIGKEEYPEREYEGFKLPAGEYYSLRVKIGQAEGKNWWCVLFPPLCTTAAEERNEVFVAAGFTGEQYRTVTETGKTKYKIKFKILEVLEEIFREKN